MRFVPKIKATVRTQLVLWVFTAILLSWIVSGAFSALVVYNQVAVLRRQMLARPDLYPNPIPPPRFDAWSLLAGPQQILPRSEPPPHAVQPRDVPPGVDTPPGPPDAPPPPGVRQPEPPPRAPRIMTGWPWLVVRSTTALLFALVTGVLLGRRFTRPLESLAHGARAYQRGEYQHHILLTGENEFTQVAAAMHEMAEQVSGHIAQVEADAARRRQLLADVAHELRGPVMTMRTMSGALAEGLTEEPERRQRAADALVRSSERLLHLVTDLLELAKLDLHELPLHPRRVDLRQVVETALLHHQQPAQHAGITLHPLSAGAPVPAVVDPDRITQVLDNLLDNALSYAGAGAEILVTILDGTPLRLMVADTGRGIPAHHLAKVFDPFYRVDAARSPKDQHSGLGLRIARGLVEAHGGTLSLTSIEGEGTTVMIELPSGDNSPAGSCR